MQLSGRRLAEREQGHRLHLHSFNGRKTRGPVTASVLVVPLVKWVTEPHPACHTGKLRGQTFSSPKGRCILTQLRPNLCS